MQPISTGDAFLFGMLGAVFTYVVIFRAKRLKAVIENFALNWRVVIFDIFIYTLAGGFVAAYIVSATTQKEAILTGIAWNAVVAGFIQSEVNAVLVNYPKR